MTVDVWTVIGGLVLYKIAMYCMAKLLAREEVDAYHEDIMTKVFLPFTHAVDTELDELHKKVDAMEARLNGAPVVEQTVLPVAETVQS